MVKTSDEALFKFHSSKPIVMSDENGTSKKSILYTILITLLVGGSSPWWFDKLFSKTPESTKSATSTESPAPAIVINKSPVANAGSDIEINLPLNSADLNGSASYDPDGQIVSYRWEKQSGPQADIMDAEKNIAKATNLNAGYYEFKLTVTDDKGERDVKIKKISVSAAPAPPPPALQEVMQPFVLDEFGTWGKSIRGDNEVDTDEGDIVPVKFSSELIKSESRVMLKVSLSIREDGGDHTTFDHTMERQIFVAPAGRKIVDVRVRGNDYSVRFEQDSRGENHRVTAFRNVTHTYWNFLRFRVDGPGSDDNTVIGVAGSMTCTIILQDN
ncbi:MAG TPA: PKD domain-containing protein [Chitinophagaceae bacterium]